MFIPTKEQEAILALFKSSRVCKVNACAGSGKSTTLRYLAENHVAPSLYICFNKSVAEDASKRFPSHVECRTSHSLAYSPFGRLLSMKLKRPTGNYVNVARTASEIVLYFKVGSLVSGEEEIPARTIASLAREAVDNYETSAEPEISTTHLPYNQLQSIFNNHPNINKKKLKDTILRLAKKIWEGGIDVLSEVMARHETYLKLWQLSNPVLSYDTIYVDEAQDTNPVVMDVLIRQTQSKIVYVGDEFQSIYQFRGAINAMQHIDAPSCGLTQSFRYGQAIADVATHVIRNSINIKGTPSVSSSVKAVRGNDYTMLFRTNGALLEEAVTLLGHGKKVFCEIDTKAFAKRLESALALSIGDDKNIKHEDITPYPTWEDLVAAAENDPELRRLQQIIDQGRTFTFLKALRELERKQTKANIILTTAHKAKGREWDNVIIADDFPVKAIFDPDSKAQQEINLFYVAVTRAIKTLQLPIKAQLAYSELQEALETND